MNDFMSEFLSDKDRIEIIRTQLIEASDIYYNLGKSSMTDEDFDKLRDELKKLSPEDPWLKTIGAPVKVSVWKKAKHNIPMSSLNKVNSELEFRDWASEIGDTHYILMDKLDGFSMDLEYRDGLLKKAVTRGDGLIGEDILTNAKRIKNVKQSLPGFSGSLRGEIFIFAEDFVTLNGLISKEGKEELKNSRNGAAGTAKRFDGKYSEYLTILYYDVMADGKVFSTEEEKLDFIKGLGIPLCFYSKVTVDEAAELFKQFEDHKRADTPYDIDGLVIKANNLDLQKKHGQLGGNPKAQIAWKFASLKKETSIDNVEWSLGNNQRITPVAVVVPTAMGGVTITHATLHNVDNFINLKLGKGDRVVISRRNDVIPFLENVVEHIGAKFKIPDTCPECGEKTMIDGKFLVCLNPDCRGLAIGGLQKWINSLDIMDIGPSTLISLYDSGKVKDPSDLYKINPGDIVGLERMGEKTAVKILKNLNEKKELPLPVFIAGLNMNDFSEKTAMLLMGAGYNTVDKMLDIKDPSELVHIPGIEVKTATQIINGLSMKRNLIGRLLSAGITIKEPVQGVTGGCFTGMSFCFTGAIQKMTSEGQRYTREMMEDIVTKNGGQVAAVTKNLSYLVTADPESGSSKTQKAKKLGIKILTEDIFFEMAGII